MLSLIKTGRKSMLVVKEFIILIFLLVLVSLPLLLKLFNYFISMPKAKFVNNIFYIRNCNVYVIPVTSNICFCERGDKVT